LDNIEAIIGLAEEIGAERLELANTQFNGWALKNRNLLLSTRSQIENAARKVEYARKRLKDKMEILGTCLYDSYIRWNCPSLSDSKRD
jgi:pyrroloquinoline quinone biosynthesis protein E